MVSGMWTSFITADWADDHSRGYVGESVDGSILVTVIAVALIAFLYEFLVVFFVAEFVAFIGHHLCSSD